VDARHVPPANPEGLDFRVTPKIHDLHDAQAAENGQVCVRRLDRCVTVEQDAAPDHGAGTGAVSAKIAGVGQA